jgi:hypothetical protein
MTTSTNFLVERNALATTQIAHAPVRGAGDLQSGEVLLRVDRFAFTANNITYAAFGDAMAYWQFFPTTEPGTGSIPVWGFADVAASSCEGIEVGERLYGYFPMSTHLIVAPHHINAAGFIDGMAHRQSLSLIYNHYLRCAHDPLYQADTEALQMLLRPLFTTSFLLDDFFAGNGMFGARTLVLTSASSKTALGMAFLLHRNRGLRDSDYEIVGLTSPGNIAFVEGLGCYDRVLGYDQVAQLDKATPSVIIDFAGSGEILGQLHHQLAPQLQYSCLVGASHWDERGGMPDTLPGPAPELFFAPSQAEKRVKELGGEVFQQRLAEVWLEFVSFVGGWMNVEYDLGPEAVERVYQNVLAGRFKPDTGYILSLSPD